MKIVIAGGTGQIGGLLRRSLVAQGHDVVVLSRTAQALEPGFVIGFGTGEAWGIG